MRLAQCVILLSQILNFDLSPEFAMDEYARALQAGSRLRSTERSVPSLRRRVRVQIRANTTRRIRLYPKTTLFFIGD